MKICLLYSGREKLPVLIKASMLLLNIVLIPSPAMNIDTLNGAEIQICNQLAEPAIALVLDLTTICGDHISTMTLTAHFFSLIGF